MTVPNKLQQMLRTPTNTNTNTGDSRKGDFKPLDAFTQVNLNTGTVTYRKHVTVSYVHITRGRKIVVPNKILSDMKNPLTVRLGQKLFLKRGADHLDIIETQRQNGDPYGAEMNLNRLFYGEPNPPHHPINI